MLDVGWEQRQVEGTREGRQGGVERTIHLMWDNSMIAALHAGRCCVPGVQSRTQQGAVGGSGAGVKGEGQEAEVAAGPPNLTYIFRRLGSFLKIPVASRTEMSLSFSRLHGKPEEAGLS